MSRIWKATRSIVLRTSLKLRTFSRHIRFGNTDTIGFMENSVYTASTDRYDCGMKYVKCGRSGVAISALSLGLWQNFGDTVPYERSRKMILYAFDKGINHFDLANNYGPSPGSAEETFGKVMRDDLRPYRDELFISTKAGYDMWDGPYGRGGSRKYLVSSLDQSLKRMHLDYVDIFYSHRYDPETPLEETMQALTDIVRSGKALYAGISNYPADKANEACEYLESRDVHCLLYQGRYNMIDRRAQGTGILRSARKNGTGFIAFSPLAQGLLTDRYLNGIPEGSRASREGSLKSSGIDRALRDKLKCLNEIASGRGQSLAQMSLAWLLADKNVCSVIVGASSIAQLEDNLHALSGAEFDSEELGCIDEILGPDIMK